MPSFDNWRTVRRVVAVVGILYCAYLVSSGRHSNYAIAAALALVPIGGFTFFARPYIFPYAIYIFLIPFDTLLTISSFGTLSRLLGLVSGFAMVLYALRTKTFVRPPVTILTWTLYVLWAAATIAWSIDPAASMKTTATLVQVLLLYTVLAITPLRRADFRIIIGAVILGGLASGGYGAWLFHHQDPMMLQAQQQLQRLQIQVGQNSIDSNHFADALLFPCVALIVLTLRESRKWHKAALIGGVALIILGLYYSASRESLVALFAALVYLGVVSRYRRQLLIVGGFILGLSLALPMIWMRFGQALATGGSGRLSIWETGLEAAKRSWLFGAGISNFPFAYDNAYVDVYQRYSAGWTRPAHNLWLQTLVELGVIGLVLLGIALVAQFRLVSVIPPEHDLHDYRLMLQGSMVALMVAALFIDMMIYKYLWLLFGSMAQLHSVWRSETQTARSLQRAAQRAKVRVIPSSTSLGPSPKAQPQPAAAV